MNEAVAAIMDGDPFFERLLVDDHFRARKKLDVALRTAYRAGYKQADADTEQALIADLRASRRRGGAF